MMIGMIPFWGAIVVGIAWLVRGSAVERWQDGRRETPIEILERRLAEGAISPDQYHERREVISGSGLHRSEPRQRDRN